MVKIPQHGKTNQRVRCEPNESFCQRRHPAHVSEHFESAAVKDVAPPKSRTYYNVPCIEIDGCSGLFVWIDYDYVVEDACVLKE